MNECDRLEKEIQELKFQLSVSIPEELQNATEAGDLGENSEFSEIISRQTYLGIRLNQLNKRFFVCKTLYNTTSPGNSIYPGCFFKVKDLNNNKEEYFKMVATEISDQFHEIYQEITVSSPLGRAFVNKQIGDNVTVKLPTGILMKYKILEFTQYLTIQS